MPVPSDAREARSRHTRRRSKIWWGILPVIIPVLTGLLLSWHSLGDLDIWFHLRAGRDLLDGQGVTSVNRYSFTEPDHPWVNHEWMFQVLAAMTGPETPPPINGVESPNVTGWNLMRSALTLLLLLTILGGDRGISRLLGREGASAAAWTGVPVLAGLLLLWPRLTIRPELFSYLFFVLLVRWAEQYFRVSPGRGPTDGESPDGRWTALLDPRRPAGLSLLLTVVWAQFHGFASLAPLLHVSIDGVRNAVGALQVDGDDRIPEVLSRVGEGLVAQDARVVDDDVAVVEGVDRSLQDRLPALDGRDVVVVGCGLTAGRLDLVDDLVRHGRATTRSVAGAAQIVHHHCRAFRCQSECVLAAQSASGARYDRDFSIQMAHGGGTPCRGTQRCGGA